MLDIIKSFLARLYDLLPDSPFQTFFTDKIDILGDILGWVNWFIPFDMCFKITELWVAGIAAYYLFMIIKKIVFDLIIGKLVA